MAADMKKRNLHGFTLIEILVSVALFSLVMVVALGALLSMSVSIRKAESINSSVNNLSSAIDALSRSVRTGTNYSCDFSSTAPNCTSTPYSSFSFTGPNGLSVKYCLSDPNARPANSVCLQNSSTAITACPVNSSCMILRSVSGGVFSPLTSAEINIGYLGFWVTGAVLRDGEQPKVTIVVSGTLPVTNKITSDFNIQTSVTQRIYDR